MVHSAFSCSGMLTPTLNQDLTVLIAALEVCS
jgi:hypothetical protein